MTFHAHVFDTETASLQGGVAEIAIAVINENFDVVWSADSLINPERPIDPSASGVHHITDAMVKNSPTLREFMAMHNHPFDFPDLTLVGHNVAFDIRMCAQVLPPTFRKACTLKLARAVWPKEVSDHKLQTLRYHFGLESGDAHRAMGDVHTTISLMKLISKTRGWSLAEMVRQAQAPISLDTPFPFGKHKGTKLRDIPKAYASWALRELKDLDPDLKVALTTIAAS